MKSKTIPNEIIEAYLDFKIIYFTNAVGDLFGLGTTVTQNIYTPTPFTIRAVNKFQYYFKTNVCYYWN